MPFEEVNLLCQHNEPQCTPDFLKACSLTFIHLHGDSAREEQLLRRFSKHKTKSLGMSIFHFYEVCLLTRARKGFVLEMAVIIADDEGRWLEAGLPLSLRLALAGSIIRGSD